MALRSPKVYFSYALQAGGLIGILYGGFTFFHNRENKIEQAVTQKELTKVVNEFSTGLSVVKTAADSTLYYQKQLNSKQDIFESSLVNHIKKDKTIPADEKIQDILNIVQGIAADVKKK